MSKTLFDVIIAFSLFIIVAMSQENVEDLGKIVDDYNDKYKEEFNSNMINYLKKNFLYKNEVVIVDKKAFRKIFKDIISSGDYKVFNVFKKLYNKIADEFIKEIYPKGVKTILATELDKYFDYDYVMNKFNKYITNHKINYEDL